MLKIDKHTPPLFFTEFIKESKPKNWAAASSVSSRWRQYILANEQNWMSGYTEKPIRMDNSHIDHFHRKGINGFEKYTFDWNNFIVDEINNTQYGAGHKDKIVKTVKDYDDIIDPVVEEPSRFFLYAKNGKILSCGNLNEADERKAKRTIEVFNLNHPELMKKRSELFAILENYTSLPDETVMEALEGYGFVSVIEQEIKGHGHSVTGDDMERVQKSSI